MEIDSILYNVSGYMETQKKEENYQPIRNQEGNFLEFGDNVPVETFKEGKSQIDLFKGLKSQLSDYYKKVSEKLQYFVLIEAEVY